MMQAQSALALVTVVAWGAVLSKLPVSRRHWRDAAFRFFWWTLLLLALALTLFVTPVTIRITQLTGWPDSVGFLSNGIMLVAALTAQAALAYLAQPAHAARSQIRRSTVVVLLVLLGMALIVVAIPGHRLASPSSAFVTYRLLFLGDLGYALQAIARLAWCGAEAATRPSMRLGLWLVTAGATVGCLYCLRQAGWMLAVWLGLHVPPDQSDQLAVTLQVVSVFLVIAGSTLPSWGPRVGVDALANWVADYRSLRRLAPLWHDLCRSAPEVVLFPPASTLGDYLDWRDVRLRLCRRVVEIRDALLVVRPWTDPRAVTKVESDARAAGLPEEQVALVVEAVGLASALFRRSHGARASVVVPPEIARPIGGRSLMEECRTLERLVHCYRNSSVVRSVLQALAAEYDARSADSVQSGAS